MFILYGQINLMLPYASSLKDKRMIVQSILARVNKRINLSISEVAYQDLWQRCVLGFSGVCSSHSQAEMLITVISDVLDQHENDCEVLDLVYEINKYDLI